MPTLPTGTLAEGFRSDRSTEPPPLDRPCHRRLCHRRVDHCLLGPASAVVGGERCFGRVPAVSRLGQPPRRIAAAGGGRSSPCGMYHWERGRRQADHAVGLFARRVARDPEYAEPYAGLANCYCCCAIMPEWPMISLIPRHHGRRARACAEFPTCRRPCRLAFTPSTAARFPSPSRVSSEPSPWRPARRGRALVRDPLLHMGEFARALEQIGQRRPGASVALDPATGAHPLLAGREDEAVAAVASSPRRPNPTSSRPTTTWPSIHLHRGDHALDR
jgi:hypothetical protein